jgi:hypothetical protein
MTIEFRSRLKIAYWPLFFLIRIVPTRPAHAQIPYRFEAFGSLGAAKYDASPDHKFNFGGGIGVRPFSRNVVLRGLGVEFQTNLTSGQSNLELPTRTSVTGDLLYQFSLRSVEPYVLIGTGFSSLGCYGLNEGCDPGARIRVGGFGLRIFFDRHVSFRPEFTVTEPLGRNPYFGGPGGAANHLYRASFGIGYHWGGSTKTKR